MIDNNRKILDKVLVKKLESMKLSYFLESSVQVTDRQTLIAENEDSAKNPTFVAALESLRNAIIYLGMFLYPLYLKESPTSAEFSSKPVYTYLP
jgi:hypothetical protein|uniref:Uncharacterized protein n=1 Tax=viral metagenome TaxID=1070528 RepID=A0A6C0BH95_9ZZZZ